MSEILAVSLNSMQADMARLDQVAMNLANALTSGYKRGIAVQAPQGASFAAHLSNAAASSVQFAGDSRPGTLKSTGQSLDVALAGKGYFEVTTDAGPAYTRQGSFRLDARGRVVTAQGHPVMGTGGEITLNAANVVISASGLIAALDGTALGQLKVVEFEGDVKPQPTADGLFAVGAGTKLVAQEEVRIHQGFLENSNVNSTTEMTSMVQVMRHFESMQKVAQSYDDMLGTAIRKLGETS